jgi:hypothetical protein
MLIYCIANAPNFLKALYKRLFPDQGETNYKYKILIMDVLYCDTHLCPL